MGCYQMGGIASGTRVRRGDPLFPRIDVEAALQEDAQGGRLNIRQMRARPRAEA